MKRYPSDGRWMSFTIYDLKPDRAVMWLWCPLHAGHSWQPRPSCHLLRGDEGLDPWEVGEKNVDGFDRTGTQVIVAVGRDPQV